MTDNGQLVTISEARLAELVETMPVEKRAAFSKALKAASQHVLDCRRNYGQAFKLAAAMVENWWHLGGELKDIGISPGQPKKNSRLGDYSFTLSDLGLNKSQSERSQKLRAKQATIEDLRKWTASFYDEQKCTLPALKSAVHVSDNTGEPEWYTPADYVEAARRVLGCIDLDPASSDAAQGVVNAAQYYTKEDDGLLQDWGGRVWMNPPYASELVGRFVGKLVDHCKAGDVSAAISLTNNATETAWFQNASCHASCLCLPASRIRFLDELGNPGAPLQGQSLLYFGDNWNLFAEEFGRFGAIWVKT